MSSYQVTHLTDIEEQHDGRCPMRPIRLHFGITTFGVNGFTARSAGDRLINEHDETDLGVDEIYLVLQGRATFELDGDQVDAPHGTLVFAPAGVTRTAFAREAGTTLIAFGGGQHGEPYRVEGWEVFAPLMGMFREGKYAEVADRARPILAEDPPYATLYYNVACAESLAHRPDDALRHLRRAIELHELFRGFAAEDPDFADLRDTPEFKSIVADPGE